MKPLLVADDFDGLHRLRLVVEAPHDLAEGPFAEDLDDLEAVREVVVRRDGVVAALVVVPVVLVPGDGRPADLLRAGARVPDLRVLQDLRAGPRTTSRFSSAEAPSRF